MAPKGSSNFSFIDLELKYWVFLESQDSILFCDIFFLSFGGQILFLNLGLPPLNHQ